MALALRGAGRLKPEARLSIALQEFEAVLDHNQREELQVLKQNAAPDASAPLAVVSLLDQELSQRTNGRRCIGPKVLNLLQSVQQFSGVVDVFVSGAQNIIASSIWGTVRLSLKVGINYLQHLDKLCELLMDVGRSCPRYQEFGTLFIRSKGLQKVLCEYFVTVIQLCKQIVLFSQRGFKTKLSQLLDPFDTTFGDTKAELHRLAKSVQEETTLASSKYQVDEIQMQGTERMENARFRSLMRKFREDSSADGRLLARQIKRHERTTFLNALSDYSYSNSWKQARKKGSVKWIFEHADYKRWKSSPQSSILCLVGRLGSGKTVSMANIVTDVVDGHSAQVGYFFCRIDDAKTTKTATIIRSIVRQLLSPYEFEAPVVPLADIDAEDTIDLLGTLVPKDSLVRFIVCIDGLDECHEDIRKEVISNIKKLTNYKNIQLKFVYSVRSDTQENIRHVVGPHDSITLSGCGRDDELKDYIQHSLECSLESGELQIQDFTLILRIKEELVKHANGMYLWVFLQLRSICQQTTDAEIIEALKNLPRDLDQTYTRILARLYRNMETSQKIFGIVAVAERPLTVEELNEAMAVKPPSTNIQISDLSTDMRSTLARHGGSLITVDEEDYTIHFVHQSVHQFLTNAPTKGTNPAWYHVDVSQENVEFGKVCMTYLNLKAFNHHLTRPHDQPARMELSPASLVKDTLLNDRSVSQMALRLLKASEGVNFDLQTQIRNLTFTCSPRIVNLNYVFIDYAKEYVLTHTKELLMCSVALDGLFITVCKKKFPFLDPSNFQGHKGQRSSLRTIPGFGETDPASILKVVHWAAENDHEGILWRFSHLYFEKRYPMSIQLHSQFYWGNDVVSFYRIFQKACENQSMRVIAHILENASKYLGAIRNHLLIIMVRGGPQLVQKFWDRLFGCNESFFYTLSPTALSKIGIDLKTRAMYVTEERGLFIMQQDYKWDLLNIAVASDNLLAVEKVISYMLLEWSDKFVPTIQSAFREAACRDRPLIFQKLFEYLVQKLGLFQFAAYFISYDDHTIVDQYGWSILQYAATLFDWDHAVTYVKLMPIWDLRMISKFEELHRKATQSRIPVYYTTHVKDGALVGVDTTISSRQMVKDGELQFETAEPGILVTKEIETGFEKADLLLIDTQYRGTRAQN